MLFNFNNNKTGVFFMLHILYRFCNQENSKKRPQFFSKKLCLENFIIAFNYVKNESTFHLICDGEIEQEIVSLTADIATIEQLPSVGNSASFLVALEKSLSFSEQDLIYFVEDDYLHCPDSLVKLLDCQESIECDYITLYDHPVRYMPDYELGRDWAVNNETIYLSKSHHWREVESTCMTFASTSQILKADFSVFEQNILGRKVPNDRELFRQLQHLGSYQNAVLPELPRKLVGPIPSLATHCEEPWLAPVISWEDIAYAKK